MARMSALAKMLYYPTCARHAADLGSVTGRLLAGSADNRERPVWILDPNAGEGSAVRAFAGATLVGASDVHVTGVELDAERCATLRLTAETEPDSRVRWSTYLGDQFSHRKVDTSYGVDVVFQNPPYHSDLATGRVETRFVLDALRFLTATNGYGLGWFIIPEVSVADTVSAIAAWRGGPSTRAVGAYRFRPEEYSRWSQVAVLVFHGSESRYNSYRFDFRGTTDEILDWSALDKLTSEAFPYNAARAANPQNVVRDHWGDRVAPTFRLNADYYSRLYPKLDDQKLLGVALDAAALEAIDLADPLRVGRGAAAMLPSTDRSFGRPLVPLAAGHLALVASAGVLDGAEIIDPTLAGHAHTWRVKGTAPRAKRRWTDLDESGKVVEIERQVIKVTFTLYCAATKEVISWNAEDNLAEIEAFLSRNAEQIRRALEGVIPSRLTEDEARATTFRARAPGGKTPWQVQRRTIGGVLEGLKSGNTILCGEQGVGKTFMLSAVAREVLHSIRRGVARIRPVVVMCPGHLVEKWAAEWRDVTGLPATIAETHEDVLSYAEAIDAYQGRVRIPAAFLGAVHGFSRGPVRAAMVSRCQAPRPGAAAGHPGILIVSKETAKLGAPWRWAVSLTPVRARVEKGQPYETLGYRATCPHCNRDVSKVVHNATSDFAHNEDRRGGYLRDWSSKDLKPNPKAPKLTALDTWTRSGNKPRCWTVRDADVVARERQSNPDAPATEGCGAPLWSSARMATTAVRNGVRRQGKARAPLAYTIARKLSGYVLILDECQDYTAKSADQAHTANRLARHAWRTIPATGTLADGFASSLFYLLYWTSPEFRQVWKFGDIERFVATHGIVERVTVRDEASAGAMGGRRSAQTTVREVPGVDPGMFRYLISNTVFMRLEDVKPEFEAQGKVFPKYEETVEFLETPWEIKDRAQDYAQQARKLRFEDAGEAARLWAASLYAPNEGPLSASDPLTPKEARLVELVKAQVAAGGKAAVYVTYINVSKTMPRVCRILREAGVRVATLEADDSPTTAEREAVVKQKIADADVLVTNGTLVQTGLDLLWATLIVQYGAELKTRTLSQQIRRAMRINQPDPLVRVVILSHSGVPEETYTRYVAKKIKAAATMQNSPLAGLAGSAEAKGYEMIEAFRNHLGA